jgi:PAS domain S-box-containing protein
MDPGPNTTTTATYPLLQRVRDHSGIMTEELITLVQRLDEAGASRSGILRAGGTGGDLQAAVMDAIQKSTKFLMEMDPLLDQAQRELVALVKQRSQLTTLYDISQALNSTLDLEQLLNLVMDQIIGVVRAERGFLLLSDQNSQQLEFKVARNMDRKTLSEEAFQVSQSIIDRVARERQPILADNAQQDPRFAGQLSVVSHSLRSILCVPLLAKDRLIGVVYVDNRIRAGLFTDRDRDLLQAFANQAAIAIENARLFNSLNETIRQVTEIKTEMENIFDSVASGVITIDREGKVATFNPAAENIFGLPAERASGLPYQAVFSPLARTPLPDLIEKVLRRSKRYVGYSLECALPGKGQVSLSVSLSPLKNEADVPIGCAMVVEDLTETKRLLAEQQKVKDVFQRYVAKSVVDKLLTAPPKLGGERQHVTIIFADVRGYTSFSERVTPEELVSILNTYISLVTRPIFASEGVITNFLGDGILAVYNAPLAQPDHALRGVFAALAMIRDLKEYHDRLGIKVPAVNYGIGVNTGYAVVGNIGAETMMNYTVIGDAVNTASRLCSAAKAGQIVISAGTHEAVKDHVIAAQLEPLQVKGKSQPVMAYEVTGLKTGSPVTVA